MLGPIQAKMVEREDGRFEVHVKLTPRAPWQPTRRYFGWAGQSVVETFVNDEDARIDTEYRFTRSIEWMEV
jgi:hypothetical protein